MSRSLRFLALALPFAGIFCLLSTSPPFLSPSVSAEAAGPRGRRGTTPAVRTGPPSPRPLPDSRAKLEDPSPWSRPPLQAVISESRRTKEGRELYSRSGGTDKPTGGPCGSYALLTPNQMGLPMGSSDLERRISGDLPAVSLTYRYPRRVQWDHDIALVNAGYGGLSRRCVFALRIDSPGWYAIALHLENPLHYSSQVVTNQLREFRPGAIQEIAKDTHPAPPAQAYLLAGLLRVTAPGVYHFEWLASVTTGHPTTQLVLFRGLSVDKL